MRLLILEFLLAVGLFLDIKASAQIPDTQKGIDQFIDSLGRSNDRNRITSKLLPGVTDGSNAKWILHMVYNKNNQLLWVEDKIPDSVSISYIYCQDKLVFVSHFRFTYTLDSVTNKEKPIFRNVYFVNDEIIFDSSPSPEPYTKNFFLSKSKEHLAHFKLKDQ